MENMKIRTANLFLSYKKVCLSLPGHDLNSLVQNYCGKYSHIYKLVKKKKLLCRSIGNVLKFTNLKKIEVS